MAKRDVRGADGRLWTIRERWVPPLGELPGRDLDDIEYGGPVFSPVDFLIAVVLFPVATRRLDAP